MSAQPDQSRRCPTCGNTVPAVARYCPNCGTRLNPAASYTADEFEDALADVLDAPIEEPEAAPADPVVVPEPPSVTPEPEPPVTITPAVEPVEWTASASDWSDPTSQPGTWSAQPPIATAPAKPRGNRTLWIILAIFGFLVFCCCGFIFVALLVDGTTSAVEPDLSVIRSLFSA
ncbi:MAG TPA: zinc-ribbon domain-containing protein [Thermomicrobiales bacterium]|nr:zinc-ribbon domain-containing protein [Thermomicrobiales bacterium]